MDPANGRWKRTVTFGLALRNAIGIQRIRESMSKDFPQTTFERAVGVEWLRA